MAEGILGLGTGQSTSLNQDLIDKLKEADRKAQVEPLETDLDNLEKESEKKDEIMVKYNDLLDSIKDFDLFNTSGINAFQQKAATASGSSVVFDAADVATLDTGTTSVIVTQIAQKDVYQSNSIDATTKDATVDAGTLSIAVGSNAATDIDTTGKTYDELATEINNLDGVSASVEQVGSDSFRLIIRSEETGTDNALSITGAASSALGYTTDNTTINEANHTLSAKNMQATVDGVAYDSSSNTITVAGGLKITATTIGESSLSVSDDTNSIIDGINNFVDKYNEFMNMVNDELTDANTPISNKSSLRSLVDGVKNIVLGTFGDDQNSLFKYGFEMDTNTFDLKVDTAKLQESLENNFDEVYDLFIGKAESKGLGTQLVEYMNDQTRTDGILDTYDDYLTNRKDTLTKEKDDAIEDLDSKYSTMSQQFAEYTSIITKMQSSFSGLQMMIAQSQASS
ncbi:flagellar hook protein FliD [Arcobacter sp. CECT 8986]|uniref:flagellar filament capping protein FliD n=1 Tax=Arcobacter sp. CECT 8986 TaxID=2044507 RepID=UPI001009CB09|nr:flagellar filament capping protein FliD [Arcobacter sp. CECT 8986]RXJ98579.1 flagellar hook protein FliD [Arcobacter sp. CECT 8986]